MHNRSSYPAQEKNPKGEVHEDLGFFSFDKARKRIVFRQFHRRGAPLVPALLTVAADALMLPSTAIC